MDSLEATLKDFLKVEKIEKRFFNWLCFFLCLSRDGDKFSLELEKSQDRYGCVCRRLQESLLYSGYIKNKWNDSAFQLADLDWFEKDKRFFEWFVDRIDRDKSYVFRANPLRLNYYDLSVAAADNLLSGPTLRGARQEWLEVKEFKNIISWVEGGDESSKIQFVVRVLGGLGCRTPRNSSSCSCFEEFLIWLDKQKFRKLEVQNISEKAKRRWKQQIYRGDKEKRKQINLLLDVEVVAKLRELSKKHNLSSAKIVQVLLEEEFLQDRYISGRRADLARGDI